MNVKRGEGLVPDWSDEALCIGEWEEFDDGSYEWLAKRICPKCPVLEECLADTIKLEKPFMGTSQEEYFITGIRGGMTASERRKMYSTSSK